jgi:siroheme decarboxylase
MLDDIDKAILNRIQSDFPIVPRPFEVLAQELGLSDNQIMLRIEAMKQDGIIRRIGANFVPGKVGFVSTLCAACVPEDQIDHFSEIVNRYPGVTHNYQRDNHFNVWFTFIARSREEIERCLDRIRQETGVETIMNLPATKVFKIRAEFEV